MSILDVWLAGLVALWMDQVYGLSATPLVVSLCQVAQITWSRGKYGGALRRPCGMHGR